MIDTVVKVGGSLGRNRELPVLMDTISDVGSRHSVLVIPGGGAFADGIREYDQRFGLIDDAAHWMSILAMDQYAHLLCSLLRNGTLARGRETVREALKYQRIPVLLSYDLLRRTDPLPRCWDVTSDSIAAWIAARVGARRLVLLKSVDGLYRTEKGAGPDGVVLDTLKRRPGVNYQGVVDAYFPTAVENLAMDIWLVNGKYPRRFQELLDTGTTVGTWLHC